MEKNRSASASIDLDKKVGRVAGSIYNDVTAIFPHPPLMLLPPITFKVKKILEQTTDLALLSKEEKEELAQEIQVSIVPLLFSLDIEADIIEQMTPLIKTAALKALQHKG